MKVKVQLTENSYLINCKILTVLSRHITHDKEAFNYDLVLVECDKWQDIRQIFFNGEIGTPEECEDGQIVMWGIEDEDTYEEYRKRLIDNNASILNLEIFETFCGSPLNDTNSLDFTDILIGNDTKEIIQELEDIINNIFSDNSTRFTLDEKRAYHLIAEGYILRLKTRLQREGDSINGINE